MSTTGFRSGAMWLAGMACTAGLAGCDKSSEAMRQVADLRRQVGVLQLQSRATSDWTAIVNLQGAYSYYMDASLWDDAAGQFSQRATLEIGGESFEGQDEIRSHFHSLGNAAAGAWFRHLQLQPVVHISADGLSAQARWRAFTPGNVRAQTPGATIFQGQYVKEQGIWKIHKLHQCPAAGCEPL